MTDVVNNVLPFVLLNRSSTISESFQSLVIDLSGFENGIMVSFQVYQASASTQASLVLSDSDVVSAVFPDDFDELLPQGKQIRPEFFVKNFGADGLTTITKATVDRDAISMTGLINVRRFLIAEVTTTVPAGSLGFIVSVYAHTESSPVRINQLTFTVTDPS